MTKINYNLSSADAEQLMHIISITHDAMIESTKILVEMTNRFYEALTSSPLIEIYFQCCQIAECMETFAN